MKLPLLLTLGLLFSSGPAQAFTKTDWMQSPNNSMVEYRVTDIYDGIVYVETEVTIKGKRIGVSSRWAADCNNPRMTGEYVAWVKRGSTWVNERTGAPAVPLTARNHTLYCSYIR